MKELIRINGKAYALNLQKICDFISKAVNKDVKETEILDSYNFEGKKKEISGKTIRELSTVGNGQEPIVYDLIKTVIIHLYLLWKRQLKMFLKPLPKFLTESHSPTPSRSN